MLRLDSADGGGVAARLLMLNATAYYASIMLQVAGLVLTMVALATTSSDVPGVIVYLLCLDLAVQIIEAAFYSTAVLVLGSAAAVADRLYLRFGDWLLSVPVMAATLYQYAVYRADRCTVTKAPDVFRPVDILVLIVLVLFVWTMLFVGWLYEFPGEAAQRLDSTLGGREGIGQLWAWLSLLVVFVPPLVVVAQSGDGLSWLVLVYTAVCWACYGLAALAWRGAGAIDVLKRNTAYSVLDVCSKQTLGIIFSIAALNWGDGDACGGR